MNRKFYIEETDVFGCPYASVICEEDIDIIDNVLQSMLGQQDFEGQLWAYGYFLDLDSQEQLDNFIENLKILDFDIVFVNMDYSHTGVGWRQTLKSKYNAKIFDRRYY